MAGSPYVTLLILKPGNKIIPDITFYLMIVNYHLSVDNVSKQPARDIVIFHP
jgi:hypothetical protein